MSTSFPIDQERGISAAYSKFTGLFARARYRAIVGDSNAATKIPVVVMAAPSQVADLVAVFDSSKNPLASIDAAGGLVQAANVSQRVVQVTLTAAQITSLHTVPVSLVAAPGAGLVIVPTMLVFQFKYGAVQFTGGGAVNPVYHSATANLLGASVAAATIQAAASAVISTGPAAGPTTLAANTGVDLYAATANFAAGDGTAVVTLSYDLITLS